MRRIAMLLLGMLLGCGAVDEDRLVPMEMEERISGLIETISRGREFDTGTNPCPMVEEMIEMCRGISNRISRIASLDLLADKLLSMDVSRLDYRKQYKCMNVVHRKVWNSIVPSLVTEKCGFEHVYDLRFRLLEWMEAQLMRIRPTRKIDSLHWKSYEDSRRHSEWCMTYLSLYDFLKMYRRSLEDGRVIDWDAYRYGCGQDGKAAIRRYVAKWFGRPLRSLDQIRADKNDDTEDYKAVKSRNYGP